MQLQVKKADGSTEEYFHTKVVGTICRALEAVGGADVFLAEQLAEVVTYFLYHQRQSATVSSNEIFSVVEAVLSATGYDDAAQALVEHHFERRLRRSRLEVAAVKVRGLRDAHRLRSNCDESRCRWDKSTIVSDLVRRYNIGRQTARAIASMVEEKVFNLGLSVVPSSLVKQLVLGDAAAVLAAEQQLQPA